MKRLNHLLSLFLVSLLLFGFAPLNSAQAQVVVHSSSGYDVNITIASIAIVPNSMSCAFGYSYRVRLSYTVTFTGPGAPANMYTLQGIVGCGFHLQTFDLPNGPSSGTTLSSAAWRSASDCATATVASLDCSDVYIIIQGPGIPWQVVHVPGSTLPITLVSFDAVPEQGFVRLDWATASEKDNAYFTVERSTDAIAFEPVLQLSGAGNSASMLHYSTVDQNPLAGISYYRLRQTDFNGTSTVSPVVVVNNQGMDGGTFSIFPNPSGSGEAITLPVSAMGKQIEVRNLTGQLVVSELLHSNVFHCPPIGKGTFLLRIIDPLGGNSRQCRMVRL